MSWCSRTVFKCFKWFEKLGDRITGAAGPYFVGLAVILLSTGTVCFFEVIAPTLSYPILTLPICVLIAFNLMMHYYYVVTVSPGFIDDPPRVHGKGFMWAQKGSGRKRLFSGEGGVRWSLNISITRAEETQCNKCGKTRPERAHHCRICNRCVLKYDHHCPGTATDFWARASGISQCVGVYNERHFVMFMVYLVVSCFCFVVSGWPQALQALGVTYPFKPWNYNIPEIVYILIFILSGVLCLAVGVMLGYHLYVVSNGETTVEAQDNEVYARRAKSRGEKFVNSYDLGRLRNLRLFFNLGEGGYPFYIMFFPFRIHPYTDGRSWARREGYERHHGVRRGEELTDEEEEDQ